MSEADLLKSTLQALQFRGVFCWRVNAGLTVLGKGAGRRVIRGAPAGSPDIMGVVGPRATLFGLELKAPGGKLRATQKRWSERAQKHGVLYAVAHSVNDALVAVTKWKVEAR